MEQPKIDALSHALEDVLTGVSYLTHNATAPKQYPTELQRVMHLRLLAGKLSESVFKLVKVAVGETASEAAAAAAQPINVPARPPVSDGCTSVTSPSFRAR